MAKAQLTITFSLPQDQGDTRTREGFWSAYARLRDLRLESNSGALLLKRYAGDYAAIEAAFELNFGNRLRQVLNENRFLVFDKARAPDRGLFTFRVKRVAYGSLIADLDVLNPEKLAEYFLDEDVAIEILARYSVVAMDTSLSADDPPYDASGLTDIAVAVAPSQELHDAFVAVNNRHGKAAPETSKKLALWNAMNVSLLVPCILALTVCYFAFVALRENDKETGAERSALLQHYDSLIDSLTSHPQAIQNIEADEQKIRDLTQRVDKLEQDRIKQGRLKGRGKSKKKSTKQAAP